MFLLITGSDELFPYQEVVLRRQISSCCLVMAQTEQGGLALESGPVQERQSTAQASTAMLSALRSLQHPGSQNPPLNRAARPAEVSRADVLNTWQQVLVLIPLKPAAKAPI